MAVYHLECYRRKYREEWGCPANHCLLIFPLICDSCQKEINKGDDYTWANCSLLKSLLSVSRKLNGGRIIFGSSFFIVKSSKLTSH